MSLSRKAWLRHGWVIFEGFIWVLKRGYQWIEDEYLGVGVRPRSVQQESIQLGRPEQKKSVRKEKRRGARIVRGGKRRRFIQELRV